MKNHQYQELWTACWAAAAAMACTVVHADATIEQKTTLDVASMIRSHGTSTTNITADKKREDSDSHCEGMLSLVCGNMRGGEIVRLDRGVTWRLHPDKKTYAEEAFATPEELAQMRAKMQERLEKMRSCPVAQRQQPIDKSKCEMSPPKIDVHKTDDRMSIAGHDAQRTLATLTETCTNKDTGDVCDTVVAVDVWLTQDNIPGAGDRRAFQQAYAKRLGLVDEQGAMSAEVSKFLAPYQSQIKQLTDKSSDLKGQPLKTSLRVMMGGQQCSATAKMQANGSAAAGNTTAEQRQSHHRRRAGGQGDRISGGQHGGFAVPQEKGRRLAGVGRRDPTHEFPGSVRALRANGLVHQRDRDHQRRSGSGGSLRGAAGLEERCTEVRQAGRRRIYLPEIRRLARQAPRARCASGPRNCVHRSR